MKDLIYSRDIPTKEGVVTMKRCLFQIVYPVIECADLMAAEALSYLQKQDFYKFKLKKVSLEARKDVSYAVKRCQEDCNIDFVEEYAARIENNIYPDIIAIRNSLSKIMQKNGYKYASVMSRVELVNILLQVAVTAFNGVSDSDFKHTGMKYYKLFPQYNVTDVYKSWNKIGDEFYRLTLEKNFDLNIYKEPKELLNKFYNRLFDGKMMVDILNNLVKECEYK